MVIRVRLSRGDRAVYPAVWRLLTALSVLLALLATPGAAGAQEVDPGNVGEVHDIVFPIVGDHYYSDTWGAPRGGGTRTHEGTDIMADKMVPVVAVADGTVGWMHAEQGGKCCAMALYHDDGWASWYIHLNNDTPGTDDGLGWGFAEGIERGVHVTAGQLIGYVGDSGNAEWTAPHVHFELHRPDGLKINPYPSLVAAQQLVAPLAPLGEVYDPCDGELRCDAVAMVDEGARFHRHRDVTGSSGPDLLTYGNPGDVPLLGDWDCDGERTPAMYRPTNGFMYLRNSNTTGIADVEYFYGDPSDVPLAGDWDGDGCDTLAIYRADEGRFYIKNSLGTGVADHSFLFGNPGDKPFVGDFDGDGIDTVGLHRESSGFVYFRNSNDTGPAHLEFFYGDPGDRILAGDWDGDGDDTVAIYRPSTGRIYYNLENSSGAADFEQAVGFHPFALVATGPLPTFIPPEPEPEPEPEPPPAEHVDVVLAAAGDIATCAGDGDEETAQVLDRLVDGELDVTVAALGDLALPGGSADDFADCYDPSWGQHLERTRPAAGDGDYATPAAAAYFDYFGTAAGDPAWGFYSYDVGSWHVVVLNSNCDEIGGCGYGSAQEVWLQVDLAESDAQCTAAYMHHPFYSSGGGEAGLADLWETMDALGVDIVLSGHDRHYERFAPQDAYGVDDPDGIRQFVVGTGGAGITAVDTPAENSEVVEDERYGVLALTLGDGTYSWEFETKTGPPVDSGSADCG